MTLPDTQAPESELTLPALGSHDPDRLKISFEFFPPKTEKMEKQLMTVLNRLAPLDPRFVSVTYGAGGSTRERTHRTVRQIQQETGIPVAAHLTCVGATKESVDAVARDYWDAGIKHIVCLRGDPPEGVGEKYTPHPGGYPYADSLAAALRDIAPFEITVGAYPEIHPEARDATFDLDHLKRKIDNGAVRAITQFFFDNEVFFRFLDRARDHGIDIPIVPGIMPVMNFERTTQFAKACGASIPQWLADQFDGLEDDPDTRRNVAVAIALEQCRQLIGQGIDEFHFYTLNRAELTYSICHMLGVRPPRDPASHAEAGDEAVDEAGGGDGAGAG